MKITHTWWKPRRLPWLVCRCCGLVHLKNELTERAVRKGCDAEADT